MELEPNPGLEEPLFTKKMEEVALETHLKSKIVILQPAQLLTVFGVLGTLGVLAVKHAVPEPNQGFEESIHMSIMEVAALETQLKSRTATLQHVQLLIVFGALGILGLPAVKPVELELKQGFEELLRMSIMVVVALETPLRSRIVILHHAHLLIAFGVLGIPGVLAVKPVALGRNQGFEELLLMSIMGVVAMETQ